MNKMYFALFVAFANFLLPVLSVEYLTIHENGLIESEKNHVIASALLAIEKTTNRVTIADSIVTEMVSKYGGNWYSSVTSNTTTDSGSALKLQSNQLIRFSYETYVILVFKLAAESTTTANSTRTHVMTKINAARVATPNLIENDGITNTTHVNMLMNMTANLFKSSSANFDTNVCLSATESSVQHIWDNNNCYYRLSITIWTAIQNYNVTDVTIGERNGFSNYNYAYTKVFGFTLGPLFFLIHEK